MNNEAIERGIEWIKYLERVIWEDVRPKPINSHMLLQVLEQMKTSTLETPRRLANEDLQLETHKKEDDKITKKIKNIISYSLSAARERIEGKATLVDDLGADGLDIVELVMFLEEQFGQEITDEDAEKWITVQDIINYFTKEQKDDWEKLTEDPIREVYEKWKGSPHIETIEKTQTLPHDPILDMWKAIKEHCEKEDR